MAPVAASPEEARDRFFDGEPFRPGQREAIAAVLAGRDAMVLMPTGSGKSRIFQAAALLLSGTTLVVSPLLALMRDQVAGLRARSYPGVAELHSGVSPAEQRAVIAALREGRVRLLYVTPERCVAETFLEVARCSRIALIAVDEAHAISAWGHDFRPEYQLIDDASRALGRPPLLALTATASPPEREAIVERLGLCDPALIVRGFDRPNLFYEAVTVHDSREREAALSRLFAPATGALPPAVAAGFADAATGRGIVYTNRTADARALSQWLNRHGVHAAYYHGGLKSGQRNAVQQRFAAADVRVIAATNAFGLGIDLPDLRFVAHAVPPPSIEAYYQESGRAGRDGGFARCLLLFDQEALRREAFAAGSGTVDAEDIERALAALAGEVAGGRTPGLTRAAVARQSGLAPGRAIRTLEALVAVGAVRESGGRYRPGRTADAVVQRALAAEERRQTLARTRLEMVAAYARLETCRRRFLLQYFGEYDAPERCDHCDRCIAVADALPAGRIAGDSGDARAPAVAGAFEAGDNVRHETWGAGTVQHVGGGRLMVRFDNGGYRTLDVATVTAAGILEHDAGA